MAGNFVPIIEALTVVVEFWDWDLPPPLLLNLSSGNFKLLIHRRNRHLRSAYTQLGKVIITITIKDFMNHLLS